MSATDDLKQAWLSEDDSFAAPSLEVVRHGADRSYKALRKRNRNEYIACLVVGLLFGATAVIEPGLVSKIACILVILGCGTIAWQLHRRASVLPDPGEAGRPLIDHHRLQLVRQRNALANVAGWYLLPMLPGLLLFGFASTIEAGPPFRPDVWSFAYGGFIAIVFAIIWWLNRSASRSIQAEIKELDELMAKVD